MILTIQIVRDSISLLTSDNGVMSMRVMAYRLRLMTTMFSLCLFSVPTIVLSPQVWSAERVGQSSGQSSAESIKALAKTFTVKVFAGQQHGSGVIVAKSDRRYTVVTNAHVIDRGQPYRIQTSDGKTYTAVLKSKGDTFKGNDLAVLEFSTVANYPVAQWGDSGAIKGAERLFAVGFPEGENQLLVSTGQVSLMAEKALLGGYRIGFSNETRQGMSGGALLNAQGKVIGILGQGNQAILERAYTYQDGSKPSAKVLQQMRESSFAVPIATVRQMIAPAKIAQTPQTPSKPQSTPSQARSAKLSYTGVLGEVDKISEQITVRIQGKNSQGSGVIVAKQGNTYSVLTAAHVLSKPDTYSIITSDGKQYEINLNTAKLQKGMDLAVVQFNSSNSYRVATLGTAQLKDKTRVFVSGFPTEQLSQRVITTGRSVSKETTEGSAKESYSLAEGVGLLYTNMSHKGMSGGPVLDTQGRVIAINTGAEDYNFLLTGKEPSEELNLGYSLGVPISSFVGLSSQFSVQPTQLMVERTKPIELAEPEHQRIRTQLRTMKAPGQGGTAMDWLNYGNQSYRLEDYEVAVLACEKAIQLKPDLYHAYYVKGFALAASIFENNKAAIASFDKVNQIAPSFYPAWRWKGNLLNQRLGKYSEALLAYQKALQTQGDNFTLYIEQGDVLNNLRRYEEAIIAYSKGINLNPHVFGYNNRGNAYHNLKQYDKAIVDFNKAIALQPDYASAYSNRGNAYSVLKQYDKAIVDYNQAITLRPGFAKAYINRGSTYLALRQYDKAIVDLNKAIALQPDLVEAYYNRGLIYHNLKQYDKAIVDFSMVIMFKRDFDFSDAYNNRGLTYTDLKQYEKALVDYNKAIALNPDDSIAYYNRGRTYYFLKQYEKALVDLSKAIALNPDFAFAYNNRGLTYAALKQYEKALVDYNKAYLLAQQQGDTATAQAAKRGMELLQSNK